MHAVVITDGLSIRKEGRPFSALVTELARGDEVEVLEVGTQRVVGERWHKVRVQRKANGSTVDNGKVGFAWAPGLRLDATVPNPGPIPPLPPFNPPKPDYTPSFEMVLGIVIAAIVVITAGLYWVLS